MHLSGTSYKARLRRFLLSASIKVMGCDMFCQWDRRIHNSVLCLLPHTICVAYFQKLQSTRYEWSEKQTTAVSGLCDKTRISSDSDCFSCSFPTLLCETFFLFFLSIFFFFFLRHACFFCFCCLGELSLTDCVQRSGSVSENPLGNLGQCLLFLTSVDLMHLAVCNQDMLKVSKCSQRSSEILPKTVTAQAVRIHFSAKNPTPKCGCSGGRFSQHPTLLAFPPISITQKS